MTLLFLFLDLMAETFFSAADCNPEKPPVYQGDEPPIWVKN